MPYKWGVTLPPVWCWNVGRLSAPAFACSVRVFASTDVALCTAWDVLPSASQRSAVLTDQSLWWQLYFTNKTYLWVVSSVYRWLYIFSICLFCINCHFKTLMCLTVTAEDCLKEEFSIRCGEICVISLPSLKDIYVLFCCQTYAWYLSRCFKFKEEKPHSWAVTYSLFFFAAAPVTVVKAVCTAACKPEFPKLVWTFPALCLMHISTHGSFLPM